MRSRVGNFYQQEKKANNKNRYKSKYEDSAVNWRPYPKVRQKEFLNTLMDKTKVDRKSVV